MSNAQHAVASCISAFLPPREKRDEHVNCGEYLKNWYCLTNKMWLQTLRGVCGISSYKKGKKLKNKSRSLRHFLKLFGRNITTTSTPLTRSYRNNKCKIGIFKYA